MPVRRAGIEPAMPEGPGVTVRWHAVVPSDAWFRVARVGVEPTTLQGLSLAAVPVRVPCHSPPSAPGGIRTRGLRLDRAASTPDCSTRAFPVRNAGFGVRSPPAFIPHSALRVRESARRESNPHVHRGMVGCRRYTTGASVVGQAPDRSRTCAAVLPRRQAAVTSQGRWAGEPASILARNRTWSSTFGGSRATPAHPEDVHPRAPGGGRTRDSGVGSQCVAATPRVLVAVGPGGFEPPPRRLRAESAAVTPRSRASQGASVK